MNPFEGEASRPIAAIANHPNSSIGFPNGNTLIGRPAAFVY